MSFINARQRLRGRQFFYQFTWRLRTLFGFFVELDNGVDGLVRAADLKDDYYEFVEREFALIGHATGKSFRIGDNVRVKLISANEKLRQLNFELVSNVANRDLIARI